MRFVAHHKASEPNVVVDGSPNEATVLTLTHWPGIAAPEHTWADTSAEMVFRYLDAGAGLHGDAEAVTNNHFDQDGLVGVFTLVDTDAATARRELLLDVARAGDFAVAWGRRAARVSMTISAWAAEAMARDQPYEEICEALYTEAIPRFTDLLDHPRRYKQLWEEEDAVLTESDRAVDGGRVTFEEVLDLDLAVVTVDPALQLGGGHRFAARHYPGVHPMALHRRTTRSRLLVLHGESFRYTDRYETWVQYRSREVPKRVDLTVLAEEHGWEATPPSDITPELWGSGAPDAVRRVVEGHLRSAPAAWDPFAVG